MATTRRDQAGGLIESSSRLKSPPLATPLVAIVSLASKIVIAHRGASGYLPEHTLAGKSLAIGMGADYVEQDVVLSKDNVLFVCHDIHLETTTNVAKVYPGRFDVYEKDSITVTIRL